MPLTCVNVRPLSLPRSENQSSVTSRTEFTLGVGAGLCGGVEPQAAHARHSAAARTANLGDDTDDRMLLKKKSGQDLAALPAHLLTVRRLLRSRTSTTPSPDMVQRPTGARARCHRMNCRRSPCRS